MAVPVLWVPHSRRASTPFMLYVRDFFLNYYLVQSDTEVNMIIYWYQHSVCKIVCQAGTSILYKLNSIQVHGVIFYMIHF